MSGTKEQNTEELNSIFINACEDQQNGRVDSAISAYLQLLQSFPDAPVLNYNLGLAYFEQQKFQDAISSFEKATLQSPEDMDIVFNLALSYKKYGDNKRAIQTYLRLLETDHTNIDALYNMGGCYKDVGAFDESIKAYRKVLLIDKNHQSATNNLAYVYHREGKKKEAIFFYKRLLVINPEHEAASHMLAALAGGNTEANAEEKIEKISDVYVKDLFDSYSDTYEKSLIDDLSYDVPTKLRKVLEENLSLNKGFCKGLDLGCGTGLSGEACSGLVDQLIGIDLSSNMVSIAAEKKIYHQLFCGNITHYLQTTTENYDFYIAADVFCYVGNLEEIFLLLQSRAENKTIFSFSTESYEGDDYCLGETGRFKHSKNYIVELAGRTGWQLIKRETSSLRKEQGGWVKGDLWLFKLKAHK